MKKLLLEYGLLITGGAFSFLLALNIRSVVMSAYRVLNASELQLSGSLVNAVTVILLMVLWLVYIICLQYRLERKCETPAHYLRTTLVFVLPVPVLYGLTQFIIP
jgi:heme/copper-type cytochrome/quinol oxidase subunit 2